MFNQKQIDNGSLIWREKIVNFYSERFTILFVNCVMLSIDHLSTVYSENESFFVANRFLVELKTNNEMK